MAQEADYLTLTSFLKAAEALKLLLAELDTAISGEASATLPWAISELSMGSATIGVTRVTADDEPNRGPAVIAACVRGVAQVEREAVRPQYFSDKALEATKDLSALLVGEVGQVSIRGAGQQVSITQHVAANVDEVLGSTYVAPASVEGRLDLISIHRRRVFAVWEPLEQRRVECHFPEDMLEQVRGALGKRVLVVGEVRYTASGDPVSVQVESIRVFPEEGALPPTRELAGLDPEFTGGMDSAQYVRGMTHEPE
jgi:hypothetical protein